MALPAAAFELAADGGADLINRAVVRETWAPEVNTPAVSARFHGFVSEVTGYDAQRKLWPACALEVQQILGRDGDHAGVPATARRTGQAIQLW